MSENNEDQVKNGTRITFSKSMLLEKTSLLPASKQIELVYEDILEAKSMGYSDSMIIALLKEGGIDVKLNTLLSVLVRLRKKAKAKEKAKEENELSDTAETNTSAPAITGASKPTQPPKQEPNKPAKGVEATKGGSSETGKPAVVEKSQNPAPPRNTSTFQKPRPFDRITDRPDSDLF